MDKPVKSWKVLLAVGLLLPPLAYIAGALASSASDPAPRDAIVITTAADSSEPQTVMRREDNDAELRDCDDGDDNDDDDTTGDGIDSTDRRVLPCPVGSDAAGDQTNDVTADDGPAVAPVPEDDEVTDDRPRTPSNPGGGNNGGDDRTDDRTNDGPGPQPSPTPQPPADDDDDDSRDEGDTDDETDD